MMNFFESCQYLNSFINYELQLDHLASAVLSLDRFRNLLESLGSPHKNFKSLHVAGTKGKGSVCNFASQVLKQLGFRVGLYTSPHLFDVRERIRVLDLDAKGSAGIVRFSGAILEKDFCTLVEKLKPVLEKARDNPLGPPTYFEVLTALAFCYFEQRKTDYVVLETGLGGRLDATNVIDALVCGITPIGLEHTQILGNTLSAIAAEKAAIIKTACPVIVAPQAPEAMTVIEDRCRQMQAHIFYLGQELSWQQQAQDETGQKMVVRTAHNTYQLYTSLLGKHQCQNVTMALGLVEALLQLTGDGPRTSVRWEELVARGVEETTLPGRFEIVHRQPHVILDVSHTPESIEKVGETVNNIFPQKKIISVLGLSKDKDQFRIVKNIFNFSDELILTKAAHPRAAEFSETGLQEILTGRIFRKTDSVSEAVSLALTKAQKNDVILVTGSFFVVAEAYTQMTRGL